MASGVFLRVAQPEGSFWTYYRKKNIIIRKAELFGEEVFAMNEIITKLNEIEEKAEAILLDAREEKERMQQRLTEQIQELDARYDRIEKERADALRAQLKAKTHAQTEAAREETQAALYRLSSYYEANEERLAEEIMQRVIE